MENELDRQPHASPKESDKRSQDERAGGQGYESGEESFRGLCVNCAHRCECLLPKAEGGVWHCEEYMEER
jgi:hypothetical protein